MIAKSAFIKLVSAYTNSAWRSRLVMALTRATPDPAFTSPPRRVTIESDGLRSAVATTAVPRVISSAFVKSTESNVIIP